MGTTGLGRASCGLLGICFAFCLFAAAYPTPAKAGNPEGVVSSYISSQLHRLNLSADQQPKFRRLLASTSAKRRKIFRDLGIKIGKSAGYVNLIRARNRIMSIAPGARARAAKVLSATQLRIYDKIRVEVGKLLQSKLKA